MCKVTYSKLNKLTRRKAMKQMLKDFDKNNNKTSIGLFSLSYTALAISNTFCKGVNHARAA